MISVNVSSATGFIYAFMQQPNLIKVLAQIWADQLYTSVK